MHGPLPSSALFFKFIFVGLEIGRWGASFEWRSSTMGTTSIKSLLIPLAKRLVNIAQKYHRGEDHVQFGWQSLSSAGSLFIMETWGCKVPFWGCFVPSPSRTSILQVARTCPEQWCMSSTVAIPWALLLDKSHNAAKSCTHACLGIQ